MNLGLQSSVIGLGCISLYLFVAIIFIRKGWLVRAGILMAAIAYLPILWQISFTDSDAKGFALQLLFLWPPAFMLALVGSVIWLLRSVRHFWPPAGPSAR